MLNLAKVIKLVTEVNSHHILDVDRGVNTSEGQARAQLHGSRNSHHVLGVKRGANTSAQQLWGQLPIQTDTHFIQILDILSDL